MSVVLVVMISVCGVGYDQCSSVLVFAMMIGVYGVDYDQCLWCWL